MTKISVVLPTNKINSQENIDKILNVVKDVHKKTIINKEFTDICRWNITPSNEDTINHILQLPLRCLLYQTFEDFEVIITHKYPENVEDIVKWYKQFLDIKLVKEKYSIWHKLGDYPTVNNNRNTGIMEAKGELIVFLDDYTIFNDRILQNIWDNYTNGYYSTSKAYRRIKREECENEVLLTNRNRIHSNGITAVNNFYGYDIGSEIHKSCTWTYCCSVSKEDCLRINGFDEIYDGNFGGTDQDFGRRLNEVSSYRRKLVGTIYEFSHTSTRQKIRDDEVFRKVIGQSPIPKHIKANLWKPTRNQLKRYEYWHNKHYNNKIWNKCMDVPLYNLKDGYVV